MFTIKQDEHGSYSAYATQFIPKRTVILVESPVLCGDDIETAYSQYENGHHQCQADDKSCLQSIDLNKEDAPCAIWELHDQFINTYTKNMNNHPLYSPEEKRLYGIIRSNAYRSKGGLGLYPTISRYNHSCMPNVGYDFKGWDMCLYSAVDIEEGTELCTCYTDMVFFFNREERKEHLKSKFNFDCLCVGCTLQGNNNQSQSDAKRERLRSLAGSLSQRGSDIKRSDLELILESIKIMKEEHLEHGISTTYKMAYEWALRLGEEGLLKEHLGLSFKELRVYSSNY